jgi:hypothetical protein
MKRGQQKRKVTPKVKSGVVQKKDRHELTAALGYVISRQAAGRGCRHIVSQRDVRDFTDMIPGWRELAIGLESIILTTGGQDHRYTEAQAKAFLLLHVFLHDPRRTR